MKDIEKIFRLSVVNGTDNYQDSLPPYRWAWPERTFLQERLAQIKARELTTVQKENSKCREL